MCRWTKGEEKTRAQGRANIKFLLKLFSKSLQGVGQRPTTLPLPLPLVGGSLKKARETGAFGPAFPGPQRSCPLSHGCRRASSPRGGAKYVRRQKLAQSQVSPPPLGEVPPQGAERANPPPARTCVFLLHRRGVQPPVSPAGSVGPERSPLGTRTPKARLESPGTGPQGRRWENEHLIKKARFYAGSIRCSGEHLKGRYFLKVLM